VIGRLDDWGLRALQSLTTRKYLIGVVLGWVLVVYLVAVPSTSTGPSLPGAGPSRPAQLAAPAAVASPLGALSAPALAAGTATSSAPPLVGFPALSFSAPGPPPAQAVPLSCPFPLPQSQTSPFSAGEFLSFEGPFIELSGPFASWDLPTLGAIAPLVPLVTPLVYISEPVLSALTPNLSAAVTDYLTIIDAAGLDSPQEQQYAQELEPYWLQLLGTFTPVEAALASSTPGQCLELFENELAVMDSQLDLSLPNPPLVVPSLAPGSSPSGAQAVEAATAAETSGSFAQLVLPWSGGVPADLEASVAALRAKGHPVELDLVDQPPPGQSMGTRGFPDFVAQAVHGAPQASAFEVEVPAAQPAAAAPLADLVHGLASADFARLPGQLIGPRVASAATGAGAAGFWSAFGRAMEGYQANMVDFVAADLTPVPQGSPVADQAEAASSARALEAAFTGLGGVPAQVPLFATVSLATSGPLDASAVEEQIAGYLGALRGLRVEVLGIAAG
jgi:hypothetical protein